jgi:serine/threonine-protein kinase HipA
MVLLSPAYDLNPNPQGTGLTLNISETDNSLEIDLAMEVASYFRLDKTRANHIVGEILNVVADWKTEARLLKIPAMEQDRFKNAFSGQ